MLCCFSALTSDSHFFFVFVFLVNFQKILSTLTPLCVTGYCASNMDVVWLMWASVVSECQRRSASQAAWSSSCFSSSSLQCWSKCPWRTTVSSLSLWRLSGSSTVSQPGFVHNVKRPEGPLLYWIKQMFLLAAFGAVLQGSLFGLVGMLPQKYSTIFMSGQGLAGTFAAIAMLLAIGSKPPPYTKHRRGPKPPHPPLVTK